MIADLELADYLLIAERVLGPSAEVIANFNRIGLAESALAAPQAGFGDVEAYTRTLRRRPPSCAGTSSRTIHSRTATSAARSWPPSSSWSATAELGFQRPVIRMRPTA